MENNDLDCRAVLNKAADLIDLGWKQGTYAADESGMPVDVSSLKAVNFCALGAITRAVLDIYPEVPAEKLSAYRCQTLLEKAIKSERESFLGIPLWRKYDSSSNIILFNDNQAKSADEVSMMMRKAAERA